jgi:hypothetical protein
MPVGPEGAALPAVGPVSTPAALAYFTGTVGRGAQIGVSRRVVQRALLLDRRIALGAMEVRGTLTVMFPSVTSGGQG